MAHVIWKDGKAIRTAALPRSDLHPAAQVTEMSASGHLPFSAGTPYVAIGDDHKAAPLAASRLEVDFTNGVVSVLPAPEELPGEEAFATAIQDHIDSMAKSRGYGSGTLLASYVASTVPGWATEAQVFVAWRDAVWLAAYGLLAAVQGGHRSVPPIEDVIGELPAISWPNA